MKNRLRKLISILLVSVLLLTAMGGAAAQEVPDMQDVLPEDWFHPYVQFVTENNIMLGTGDGMFSPRNTMSRAMAATVLYRLAEEPETQFQPVFQDVADGQWYSDAVIWANSNDIVLGIGGGRFAPHDGVSRQEFAVMLYRYAVSQGYDIPFDASVALDFPDVDQISDWAEEEKSWAVYNELLRGTDLGELNPRGTVTRAEAAALLMRFVELRPEPPIDEDFVLTISVEETTLPQGENFIVNVELKNNSGEDKEIVHVFLFWPHIPNWHLLEEWGGIAIDPPYPKTRLIEAGGVIRNITFDGREGGGWLIGNTLEPGTHELRFVATFSLNCGQDDQQPIEVSSNTIVLTVLEPEPQICPGCGDERSYWVPGDDEDFEDNSMIIVLTRCVSRADNRDWTLDDFDGLEGALYVEDLMRLSDRQYNYFRRVWDAERDAYMLNTPEAWQAFGIADQEAMEAYPMANWRNFRRIVFIRLDQNCKENVVRVIQQLQQLEFVRWVGPNHTDTSD